MKILLLATHINAGGITSYLLTLCRGLTEEGHQVYIGSSGGDSREKFEARGAHLLNLDIRTKSELSPKLYKALPCLKKFIQDQNIDVIHSQTRITQVMGRLLMRMTGVPYVSTCHGYFKTRLSRRIFPCWGRAVIAISEPVREHLLNDFKVRRENIHYIPNGLDIREFPVVTTDIRQRARQELGLKTQGPVLGIVARLSQVKGQDILLRAMPDVIKHFPGVRLLIVGEGRTQHQLKTLATELGLGEHVEFHPVVHQTVKYLSALDVFVMPSRQEGLGLSVMEAQACALPVVASNVGGIPSLIEHQRTGVLVNPDDAVSLAEALIKLLDAPHVWAELGSNARNFIEQHYSSRRMVRVTAELYERVIQSK